MDKAALRSQALAARKAAHALAPCPPAAIQALLAAIGGAGGQIVAGYMPIRSEIDPRPAMAALAKTARVCVPVIDGPDRPLMFRAWTPASPMQAGPFGAQVPVAGDWVQPDILIVPLVGFDRSLNRLGYGGGFYDRTLAGLRAQGRARALGLAYAAQELPAIPAEPTDQPMDAIVTENGTLAAPRPSA